MENAGDSWNNPASLITDTLAQFMKQLEMSKQRKWTNG